MTGENLPYENQLLLDNYSEDVLFIFARGMGMEQTFFNHLKLYSTPKALVLVINTSNDDEIFFNNRLKGDGVDVPGKIITAEVNVNDRRRLYMEGGVQFVTSRILIVDIITGRIPIHLVTGILVYRAHQLLTSVQESFILRLYREKLSDMGRGSQGFVKAFTDLPNVIGESKIGQLQRLVRSLYVKKVCLMPRFEVDVKDQLGKRAPEIVEISVELSPSMRKIQSALIELISTCLRELKICNPDTVDSEEDDEAKASILFSLYDSLLERRLRDAHEQSLSDKTQRLLADVKFLRMLLRQMETMDPAIFYNSLQLLKHNQKEFSVNSGWLFTSAASTVFTEAENRIKLPTPEKMVSKKKRGKSSSKYDLEYPPKWAALKSVLSEIKKCHRDIKQQFSQLPSPVKNDPTASVPGSVLVLTNNRESAQQTHDLIKVGAPHLLAFIAAKNLDGVTEIESVGAELPPEESLWPVDSVCLSWESTTDQQMFPAAAAAVNGDKMFNHDRKTLDVIKAQQKERLKELRKFGSNPTATKSRGRKNQKRLDSYVAKSSLLSSSSPTKKRSRLSSSDIGDVGGVQESEYFPTIDNETPVKMEQEESERVKNPILSKSSAAFNPEKGQGEAECSSSTAGAAAAAASPQEETCVADFSGDNEEDSNQGGSSATTCSEEIDNELLIVDGLDSFNRYRLISLLEAANPSYIVLLHSDLLSIRTIEMYKARRPDQFLRLYVLQYNQSGEEQLYLTTLNREKRAFEFLVEEKGNLLVPREFDTARDPPPQTTIHLGAGSTRRGGGNVRDEGEEEDGNERPAVRARVIVDLREFRSELPLLLYKRGIDVIPVTLEVGDYILTSDTCVERKSYSDLAGSLISGRLYTQAQQMLRHYSRVILLIEGDHDVTGGSVSRSRKKWGDRGAFTGEMGPSNRELRGKLALLTRRFPQVRIVWSHSPAATVEVFEELKWEKDEPDEEVAQLKKSDEMTDEAAEGDVGSDGRNRNGGKSVLNPTHMNMLLCIPGVAEGDLPELTRLAPNFQSLCGLRLDTGRWKPVCDFLNARMN